MPNVFFLHNHPFNFDNPYGDVAGTVIPSDPDIQTFADYMNNHNLGETWITNGLDTGYNKGAVEKLQALPGS